ncbi:MAG: cyclic nucleotide-binding domain-containing protein [Candidatus Hydrogenedentota bacterium]|nr:MAG: cyclic nucleotide-binding domain-containing protein [Candidatus Hydrogenedentota bacterium]
MLFFKKKGDIARIYQGLKSSEMKQLTKAGIEEWFAKGSPIFRKGQTGKEMFIIVEGAVHIVDDTVTPPRAIALLREGELFGELSLTTKTTKRSTKVQSLRRSASAVAAKDTMLFVVEEEVFRDLIDRHPSLASKLLMNLFYITGERLRELIRGKLLDEGTAPPKLLRGLKEGEKRKLLRFSNVMRVPKGQPVFLEGQIGTELYHVLSGAIEITKKEGGRRKRLAVMGEGDIFGELGLITKKGRMASAVALSDAELLALSEAGIMKLRRKNPEIATKLFLNLFRIVTARMRSLISPMI